MTRTARRRILRYTIHDLSRAELLARLTGTPAKDGQALIGSASVTAGASYKAAA